MIKELDPFPQIDQADIIRELDLAQTPKGSIKRYLLHIVTDGMGLPTYVPVIVARGKSDGPVVGITAAVHGNELNGIPIIQRLFNELDISELKGTVVGVPVINTPSLLRKQRRFIDSTDLNHIMPGQEFGNISQVYAWRVVNRIVKHFDYLFDLHTASFGRVNSYYIRADMEDERVKQMALLQNAQIIVHNPPSDGTLRGACAELGIPAVTFEVGDPNKFQKGMIRSSLTGLHNALVQLGMLEGEIDKTADAPILCDRSLWIYTDTGGIMTVYPQVTDQVEKGQSIATLRNIFGDVVTEYLAPQDGVVIGKSVSPINQTGGRILHLGVLA